jgi:hypothetical protein
MVDSSARIGWIGGRIAMILITSITNSSNAAIALKEVGGPLLSPKLPIVWSTTSIRIANPQHNFVMTHDARS